MKRAAACRCLMLLCMLMVWAAFAPPSYAKSGQDKKTSTADADYIGADACQSCHDDSYTTFAESPHKKLLDSEQVSQRGCEACHGPGAAHANTNGDVSRIFSFAGAKPVEIRSRCGSCHEAENKEAHLHQEISCLGCHSAHHYSQKEFLLIKPPSK
jgi:hypothetical protein